jgi:hypothetical protein
MGWEVHLILDSSGGYEPNLFALRFVRNHSIG